MSYTPNEWMIIHMANEIRDFETVAIGNNSPVPAAAALLAKATHAPHANVYILGAEQYWPFQGTNEFFSLIQRGGVDLFFLGGAQIDAYGNLNLHVIGDYDHPKVRLTGGAGAGVVYYRSRRVLLFKTDHKVKGFPEQLDFVTSSASQLLRAQHFGVMEGVYTPLSILRPSPHTGRLELAGTSPGVSEEQIAAQTGFALSAANGVRAMQEPSTDQLKKLRTVVMDALQSIYPEFVERERGAQHG